MNDLLADIISKKVLSNVDEFKDNCFYYVTGKINAERLSAILGRPTSEIISYFWDQGKTIGKDQSLSLDLLKDYCKSIKVSLIKKKPIEWNSIIVDYLSKIDRNVQLKKRPPIVSIMGHIDHGKTTLFDVICQTHYRKKEIGGITQKISVSSIEFQGEKIIFLDTPGHSDFIRLRKQGISLTDLVVLVIDAKDGVMEQTKEIINHLCNYKLLSVVFINHKNPDESNDENNLERIKKQCFNLGLIPLEWISGSALKGESIDQLCETILLSVDCRSNWQRSADGIVIDSYFHSQMGFVLTEALILGGQLNVKDKIFLAGKFGSAKIIFDGQNEKKEQVFPGDLVRLVGCDFSTELGERFLVVNHDEKKKIEKELNTLPKKKFANLPLFSEKKNINLLLSANSQNSLETLKSLVGKITNPETNFTIVYELVGKLNNFAVELAKISRSFVVVFGYKLSLKQSEIFRENKLAFFDSQIIYEISDKLKKIILTQKETKESEKITGVGQIIQIFSYSRLGNIAGCQVLNGKINRNDNIHIFRGEKKIFTGLIHSLQSNKINVKTVMKGQNCGIVIRGFNDFQLKDEFIAFQKQKENVI